VACAGDLIASAIDNSETIQLYITLSRNNAKKIIWPELLKINDVYDLKGKPDNTELSLKFPDKSIIYLSGASDKSEIDKFRGLPLKKVYIDESQSFRDHIGSLIDDVLGPALMDHAGSLCLIGTPGPVPAGYFYNCAVASDAWSHHQWTFWDNPFIAQKSGMPHQQLLDRELKRRGVSTNDPTIQREWFGRWILDSESLLLRYDPAKNHYETLPQGNWNYIMGIDVGFVDADALVVLGSCDNRPETYLVEEKVIEKEDITALVAAIQGLGKIYPITKMVIDEGGLGKKIAEEIRRRHQILLLPADKVRKMENVALLNDALRRGHFKAKKTSRFAQDSYLLEIDRDKTTPDKIRVKDTYHSDVIDAALYAFRESPAYLWAPPVEKPKHGTYEWGKAEEDSMFERARENAQRQQEVLQMDTEFQWD